MTSTSTTFDYLASLFRPLGEGHVVRVVRLGDDWSIPRSGDLSGDVVIVGRMPVRGRPAPSTVVNGVRREVALVRLRLRPPAGLRVASVERLAPVHRPGRLRRLIRAATMGGLLIELAERPVRPRVIDAISAAAGGRVTARLRPSGDGSAVSILELADGDRAVLRVVPDGHPDDVRHSRAALLALEAADVPAVPRPLAEGAIAGATWTTETFIKGGHIPRLTRGVLDDVVDVVARYPPGSAEDDALAAHFATVQRMRPGDAPILERIHDAARRWAGPARVLQHGDLWLHNVLVADGRLAGIIDWEVWHPNGLPGLDLLSLLAAEERSVNGRDTGDLLVDGYWHGDAVRAALERYFASRGEPPPDADRLAGIAIGWWASRIAFADGRIDQPARDPVWARRNIEAPIASIVRRLDEPA